MLLERFTAGLTFEQFLVAAESNQDLWRALAARARVDEDVVARARRAGPWRLLVINEDWCGDSVNTLPTIARLAELAPNVELRIIERDRSLDVMDRFLTAGARAIPKVVILDPHGEVHGTWGPRPSELQAWVKGPGQALEKPERYREIRGWYARDRGRSTAEEVVRLLEGAGAAAAA